MIEQPTARPPRTHEDKRQDPGDRYWVLSRYSTLDRTVETVWWHDEERPEFTFGRYAATLVYSGTRPRTLWRRRYDITRVTVGGLDEAHHAVCAAVEEGRIPDGAGWEDLSQR